MTGIDPQTALHAGELTAEAIGTISAASGVIARIFAPLVAQTDRVQRILAIGVSACMLAIWVYSQSAYSREGLFGLVAAFGTVAMATLGIFGLTDPRVLSNAVNVATGGRMGTPKE